MNLGQNEVAGSLEEKCGICNLQYEGQVWFAKVLEGEYFLQSVKDLICVFRRAARVGHVVCG